MKSFGKKAWLLPQPVLVIGTYNEDGAANAMTAAWAGQWDAHEIVISMGSHATTVNLGRCGDFTVAFATRETMVATDFVGMVSAKSEPEKMQKTGWTAVKAEKVDAPVFTDFPLTLQCRIKEKLYESETGCYIVAEIVDIVCRDEYLADDGKPDMERMHLITFDPIHNGYVELGQRVGNAFCDGKNLK